MDAAGVTAIYVMDGDRPLTAESAGNTTFYLYGLGAIGEETNAWSYSLPDGTNTPRQLTDISGEITLSARYTPWDDTLETYGTGAITFGYFGGVLDAATGLLYVGNGQYYDPATGRFLTRDARPNSANPYVPWNPIGAIIGPLGLIALVFGRRKKGSKAGTFLALVLVVGSVGMTLSACGGGNNGAPQSRPVSDPNPNSDQTPVDISPGTDTGSSVLGFGSATPPPTFTPCPTPKSTTTSTPIPTPTSTPIPTSTPTPISCDELSDFRARTACRTYLALRDHSGWWNGYQPGNLSPQAFAGLIFRMEFSDSFRSVPESIQQETVVRNFYYFSTDPYFSDCKGGDTRTANVMFCLVGGKQLLYLKGRIYLQMEPNDSAATIAAKWAFDPRWSTADFESAFLNPQAAWKEGIGTQQWVPDKNSPSGQSFVYTAPMDWANISMYGIHEAEARRLVTRKQGANARGLAPWQFYEWAGGGDTATIVTYSQQQYWHR